MSGFLNPPLVPRHGNKLKVLAICRISTVHQDENSLADQEALYRSWLSNSSELPIEMKVIASQGSGELLERQEYLQTLELVESGNYDLVICEDLSRICRRIHAFMVCEACEDSDTRLVAINDNVDTGQDSWRMNSFFAVMKHESSNSDTSKRIRRSLRNRFSQGGVVQTIIYGYIKPPNTKSDTQLQKDPSAESVYAEWFRRLEEGQSFAEIADWLNEQEVPTGPYARSDHWIGTMVGQVTRNQILKGTRVRNRKISKRVNRTGRRKSINAPAEELLERNCPHLAFIEPARYDRVIRMITERNAIYKRHEVNGRDPRKDVPKKRSRWPGQHINCGLCGRMYVFGGHGQTDRLMCSGAREHKCWNGITVDGPLAAERVSAAILAQIETLQEFDPTLLQMVKEQALKLNDHNDTHLRELRARLPRKQRELDNLMKFVLGGGASPTTRTELTRLENELAAIEYELKQLETRSPDTLVIPTAEELRAMAADAFQDLAKTSNDFARLMKLLIPKLVVFPFRSCDGGHIVLRAKFRLQLANLVSDSQAREILNEPLERVLSVDLFDLPQRLKHRQDVVALRNSINPKTGKSFTEAEVARKLGLTITAAQRASALQRMMDTKGLVDPLLSVLEPPADYNKLRRHLHARYEFQPLDDAGLF